MHFTSCHEIKKKKNFIKNCEIKILVTSHTNHLQVWVQVHWNITLQEWSDSLLYNKLILFDTINSY